MDGSARSSNLAYVHEQCKANSLSVREVLGDVSVYTHKELLEGSQGIRTVLGPEAREKLPGLLRENWPFLPLKRWFARKGAASITWTFKEIETILGRKHTSRWYTRPDQSARAEAWVTEGYKLFKLNLEREKVTFHREQDGAAHVLIPNWLTDGKIPDDAKFEIEHFLRYIKKKYGL